MTDRSEKRLRVPLVRHQRVPTPLVVLLVAVAAALQAALYFTAGAAALAVALTLGWCHRY